MTDQELYTAFIDREIVPFIKSNDLVERRLGLIKAALLNSWISFAINELGKLDASILEIGFELIQSEAQMWQRMERAMPESYRLTYDNAMSAIALMLNDISDLKKKFELFKRN